MRLAVAGWLLVGVAVLGGTAGTAYAQPPRMRGYIFNSGPYQGHRVGKPASHPRLRRDIGNGSGRRADAERNAQQRAPATDPRRNGHMSPEDRRLLRQHIEDAVRELYTH